MPPRRLSRAEQATIASRGARLNAGLGEWGRAYRSVMQNSPGAGASGANASPAGGTSG